MTKLKFKLVESLSKDRYLREGKIATLPTDKSGKDNKEFQKLLSKLAKEAKNDPNSIRSIEHIIENSNDLKELEAVVAVMLEEANIPATKIKDLQPIITRSIISYRSIDSKINPIIHIFNNFNGDISGNQLFTFFNAFKKSQPSNRIIQKYFSPNTSILDKASSTADLDYLVKLIILLSDDYAVKKYSNGSRSPDIDQDLITNGKFKSIRDIKNVMSTFTTDDSEKISLAEWVNKLNWASKDIEKNLLTILQDKSVQDPVAFKDKADKDKFWKDTFVKFKDADNAAYDYVKMSNAVELDPSWDPAKDQAAIANAIFSYISKIDENPFKQIKLKNSQQTETIKAYLIKNNVNMNVVDASNYLKSIINKSNLDKSSKEFLDKIVNTVAKKITIFNKLIQEPLNPKAKSKAEALKQAIIKFWKTNAKITK